MKADIKLGYEIETGEQVNITQSHLIVTGVTQLSGKTTTLEALIKRSKLKAVVFKTKIGEKSFIEGTEITPFFRDRSDYEFVRSLIEAYTKEKLVIEKGTLMRLCKGAKSLVEIKQRVDEILAQGKLRGLKEEIHTRLQHYLENLIPQIQYANLSKTLMVYEGINIMNLERFSEEAQSLIIQSVADEILKTMKGVILVIPEAWKFIPQRYNNPCKRVVESFIRQGASNKNFIWIDSQDMAGVDKSPLKQISTWILGYQTERNEVKHTLDQIALPKKHTPKPDDIMNLKTGHFILSNYDGVKKVYVQPAWLSDKEALDIAMGDLDVNNITTTPKNHSPLPPFTPTLPELKKVENTDIEKFKKQLIEIREDFFNKIEEMNLKIQDALSQAFSQKNQDIDIDEIVSIVLQKIPLGNNSINKEEIISEILSKLPKSSGSITYEVAPLEKIKKDFLEIGKNKIMSDIATLDTEQRTILKFIESQNKGCNQTNILSKCLYLSATSGGTRKRISDKCKTMASLGLIRMDKNAIVYPSLTERLKFILDVHAAKPEDIQQLHDHILNEIISGD